MALARRGRLRIAVFRSRVADLPYAFAHPAAVVPVAKLLGARAVPSALAIGAMIPDAWYFVPLLGRAHGHDLPGALWFCVPAGLLVYLAFHLIFKQPLIALAPRQLAQRLAAWTTPGLPRASWPLVMLSLLAGIATHLAWDAVTHEGYLRILDAPVAGGLYLHQVLQHASTLLGTAFLAAWVWHKLRATAPMAIVSALDDRLRCVVAAAMLGFPAATFFGVLRAFDAQPHSLALRVAGVTALSAFGLVALLYSLGWKLAR
jgi:hypothetical protein